MKRLIYVFSFFLFYSYTALFIFVLLFSGLAFLEYFYEIDIPFVEMHANRPKVHVPILGMRINVPMNIGVLIMWVAMSYYFIYFFFVKEFAKIFVKSNSFGAESLKKMRSFLWINLVPLIYLVLFTSYRLIRGIPLKREDDYFIVLAHIIIAFLIYLYLDILKKGKYFKEENDLTI